MLIALFNGVTTTNTYIIITITYAIAVAFFKDIITLNDLKNMAEDSRAKILGSLLPFLAYEYGPQYVRVLWKRSGCKWEDFVVDGSIDKFVEQNVSIIISSSFRWTKKSNCETAMSILFTEIEICG